MVALKNGQHLVLAVSLVEEARIFEYVIVSTLHPCGEGEIAVRLEAINRKWNAINVHVQVGCF